MARLLVGLLALTTPVMSAIAEVPKEDAPATVTAPRRLEVHLVAASRGTSSMDPALRDVAADLRSLPYTAFERVGGATWDAKVGEAPKRRELGKGVSVSAKLIRVAPKQAEVLLELSRNGEVVSRSTLKRPVGSAAVISVGRSGDKVWVVTVRVAN